MSRQFTSGAIDENDIDNADETHFLINLNNNRMLGMCGDAEVKYADVVSGSEGMTMMVRISGGQDVIIEAAFLLFQTGTDAIRYKVFLMREVVLNIAPDSRAERIERVFSILW